VTLVATPCAALARAERKAAAYDPYLNYDQEQPRRQIHYQPVSSPVSWCERQRTRYSSEHERPEQNQQYGLASLVCCARDTVTRWCVTLIKCTRKVNSVTKWFLLATNLATRKWRPRPILCVALGCFLAKCMLVDDQVAFS